MSMEERIEDLEVKLAFQDRLIGELDALVRTFGTKLDEALRELKSVKESVRSGEPVVGAQSDKPPHY